MNIKKEYLEDGKEVDITANFHWEGETWERGRLSLRKRNGKYEVYVHWHRSGKEDILHTTEDLREAVAYENALMRKLCHDWEDVVVD